MVLSSNLLALLMKWWSPTQFQTETPPLFKSVVHLHPVGVGYSHSSVNRYSLVKASGAQKNLMCFLAWVLSKTNSEVFSPSIVMTVFMDILGTKRKLLLILSKTKVIFLSTVLPYLPVYQKTIP